MFAGFGGNFIPVLLDSALTASPICKPLPGGIRVQNIPQGPRYFARFAGYITLGATNSQAPTKVDMPTTETLERFVQRVEEGAHAEACEEFYTENSTMQENQGEPRRGRSAHVANERRVLGRAKSVYSKCVRPIFIAEDRVVIRWIFKFEWLDGSTTEMEELAYQRWEGERIAEEVFFYDPAQRVPRKPTTGANSGA